MLWPIPLEMLGSCVTFLLDNVDLSCPFTFYVLFLWIHVLCSYQTTCRVRVVSLVCFYWRMCHGVVSPHVTFLLDHVSCFDWPSWQFLIRPRLTLLYAHVSFFLIWSHGLTSFFHVLEFYWSMCCVLILARVMHWFVHMSNFYLITCLVLVLPHAQQSLYSKINSPDNQMTTIQSLHISSKPLTEFAYQAATRVHHIKPV